MTSTEKKWTKVITPTAGWLDLDLKEAIKRWWLIYLLIKTQLTTPYRQSLMGIWWHFIGPIFSIVLYQIVFGIALRVPTENIPAPLFYLSGMILWSYFIGCYIAGSNSLLHRSSLFRKIYFPRIIPLISDIFLNAFNLIVQIIYLIILMVFFVIKGTKITPSPYLVFFPFLLLICGLIGTGFGLIIASLSVIYRDLLHGRQFIQQLWFYFTPIVYPLSFLPEGKYKIIFSINPLSYIIETFRYLLFGIGSFNFLGTLYSVILGIIIFLAGIMLFSKVEKTYIDYV